MAITISVSVNPHTYIRNPLETELGRKILQYSIELFEEVGFQAFNFKELARRMSSTEASIYRYFENKHLLLVYLTSWYWDYLEYLIGINVRNIEDPKVKLERAIHTIVAAATEENSTDFIDQKKLHKIIVEQSTKAYHTKNVDEENQVGLFKNYKSLSNCVAQIIEEVNPTFQYPHALATNILDMVTNHLYYAEHLPSLTEVKYSEKTLFRQIEDMTNYFVNLLLK